tara:strand:+ start:171 stop:1016 length:846 start_codon:yes stop_codon:yes gene_type:complete
MNLGLALTKASFFLKKNSIKNHLLDAELLLANVLKISRDKLLLSLEKKLNNEDLKKFNLLLNKRKKNEPIAYINGKKNFWKTEFIVNKSVLIPRPDTEILLEQAIKQSKNKNNFRVLDIGTGSGCIIISLLQEKKNWKGIGVDLSKEAIKIAKINAKIQHLENRIKFVHSDIDKFLSTKYDLVISNPPYINKLRINYLDEDVKRYEPKMALNGGIDGYSKIEKVVKKSSKLLKRNGNLILEIGSGQLMRSISILKNNGFYVKKISKDLSRINRCISSIKID